MEKRQKPPERLWLEGISPDAISLIPPSIESIRKVSASKLRNALASTLNHVRKQKESRLITRNNRTVGLIVPTELGEIIRDYKTKIGFAAANTQISDILSRIENGWENFIIDLEGKNLAIMGPLQIFDAMDAARNRTIQMSVLAEENKK